MQRVTILPPLERPGKILCVGLNYRDHVLEGGRELPEFPTIFTKASTALIGHRGIILLSDCSQQIDFEAELAVIIGRKAYQVKREKAMNFVAAYTIMNDVTARDYQKRSSQWTAGKSFDTFAPLGPYLITRDDIPDPHALDIKAHLNGIEMQHSNTCQLIFDIPFLIEDLSAVMTLEPGDIISTGTPGGVGVYRNPPIFLQDRDVIEITITGIGTLSNSCRKQNIRV
jgi:acylpyruvate hydrolase